MKKPIELDADLLAAWSRARGVSLDFASAAEMRPRVESLLSRLRALGQRLRPGDAPPPEGPATGE